MDSALFKAAIVLALAALWSDQVRRFLEGRLPRGRRAIVVLFAAVRLGVAVVLLSPALSTWVVTAAEIAGFAFFVRSVGTRSPSAWSVAVFWIVNPLSLFFVMLGGQDASRLLLLPASFWRLLPFVAGLATVVVMIERRPLLSPWQQFLRAAGVMGAVFLLLMPNATTAFSVVFLPGILFLTLQMPRPWRQFMLFAFLPMCVLEPGLFSESGIGAIVTAWWQRALFVSVKLTLMTGYTALIVFGLRLRTRRRPAPVSPAFSYIR